MKNVYKVIPIALIVITLFIGYIIFGKTIDVGTIKLKENGGIKIRYAYGYGIATADSLNKTSNDKYIDILEINITNKDDLKELNGILNNHHLKDYSSDHDFGVIGIYEVDLSNGDIFYIDSIDELVKYKTSDNSYFTKVPKGFSAKIIDIVSKEIESQRELITSNKITITGNEMSDVTITDKDIVDEILNKCWYQKVYLSKSDMENEEVDYVVDFNNGIKITMYHDSSIGYYDNENNGDNHYITIYNSLPTLINNIAQNYSSDKGSLFDTDVITIDYNSKTLTLNDPEKIKYITKLLKTSTNSYGDLEDYNIKIENEDIVLNVNGNKIIIYEDSSYGSRHIIYQDGKVKYISISNELEKYIVNLVK